VCERSRESGGLPRVAIGGSYPDNVCRCVTPNGATRPGGTLTVQRVAVYSN